MITHAVTVQRSGQLQRARQTAPPINHLSHNITVVLFRQLADILHLRISPDRYNLQKIPCNICAFIGCNDPDVNEEQAKGWEIWNETGFTLDVFSGGIFISTNAPNF
ncbi:hypothetical protein DLB95_25655 [Salmonella enterica subsp. diarizonae]|uniref:Uncharacterized protein n=1 Tax=Salmonella diarizonae TaxID=59204 RepID=A0A5Y3W9Q2_SALDZ|nr:hypothetical protein [Salmonella enterica subsp. enterica serovar Muenchen]ECJ4380501.1 hypothetical protein [Salmonella enterica subsp. diarizonae]